MRTLIDKGHERTDKWFRTTLNEPYWLKGATLRHERVRVIQIPSLKAWYSFMNENDPYEQGKKLPNAEMASKQRYGGNWSGTTSWESYLELLDKGDDKVMNKIKLETKTAVSELEKRYDKVIQGYKFDVSGEFFDIGLVLAGIPEAWLEPDYEDKEVMRVVMRIDMGFLSNVKSDIVIENGARLLGMAKVLENLGVEIAIELYVFQMRWREQESETLVTSLTAKGFNEPINYKKLSSLLTTSHFRRGIFRIMEVIGQDDMSSGYGQQENIDGFTKIFKTNEVNKLEREIFGGLK